MIAPHILNEYVTAQSALSTETADRKAAAARASRASVALSQAAAAALSADLSAAGLEARVVLYPVRA